MKAWEDFVRVQMDGGAVPSERPDWPIIAHYGDVEQEYRALNAGLALVDRTYRGLLEIRGPDRASWLHNLTTNEVNSLAPGTGNYAFATNLQGRILFDLNVLIRRDCIWLDLDRMFVERAMKHFDRYLVTEDVRLIDRSNEFVRLGLAGYQAAAVLERYGIAQAAKMAPLSAEDVVCHDVEVTLVRNDFCGALGFELVVPADRAVRLWQSLVDPGEDIPALPVGDDAVQVRRIESGLPWAGHEVTDDVLPAETGQFDRAVSRVKGCYLGQEVVERMASRGVVARRLVGLTLEGKVAPPSGAILAAGENQNAGKLTSACHAISRSGLIGLGYLKSAHIGPSTSLKVIWEGGTTDAVLAELPFETGLAD